MRHRKRRYKLTHKGQHRDRLLKNLTASLLLDGHIETTEAKAKALRPVIEKLITKGKTETLHAQRQVRQYITLDDAATKLFNLSKEFKNRPGGYTRIMHVGLMKNGTRKMRIEFLPTSAKPEKAKK